MTWYEAEEIAKYVFRLEANLDEWSLDNNRMKLALAELEGMDKKLRQAARQRAGDRVFISLLREVQIHARHCTEDIKERLTA